MEALAAIGFAANILQFVDFVCQALKIGSQLRTNGISDFHADLEQSAALLQGQVERLQKQCGSAAGIGNADKALDGLAAECISVAGEIIAFIDRYKIERQQKPVLQEVPHRSMSKEEARYLELKELKIAHDKEIKQLKKTGSGTAKLVVKMKHEYTSDHEREQKSLKSIVDHQTQAFESRIKLVSKANKAIKDAWRDRRVVKTIAEAVAMEWNKTELQALVAKLERIRMALFSEVMLGIRQSVARIEDRSEKTKECLEQVGRSTRDSKKQHETIQSDLRSLKQAQIAESSRSDARAEERHGMVMQAIDTFTHTIKAGVLFPTLPRVFTDHDPSLQSAAMHEHGKIENAVLAALYFRKLEVREAQIPKAHEMTFAWILQERDEDSTPRSNFKQWLENDNGCYWIEGRAGSGKSTLMKYLHAHPETRRALSKWAGSQPCILAPCFFWNAGTELQKNQEGLLRALLYTILNERRDVIARVFPGQYNAMMIQLFQHNADSHIFFSCDAQGCLRSFQQPSQLEEHQYLEQHPEMTRTPYTEGAGVLTTAELTKGFDRLLTQNLQGSKVCLLVDGLDEFVGDQQGIVKLFHGITRHPCFKAIVSSRPEPTFVAGFARSPKLCLEDLTASDISVYVERELLSHVQMQRRALRSPELAERLTRSIISRASGVFLWVALVVKSLLQSLVDGSYPEELERIVETYPPELHRLYDHMLARLSPSYRSEASRLFQAVLVTQEVEGEMPTALRLSYFERDPPKVAITCTMAAISPAAIDDRLDDFANRVRSRCAGLLEVHRTKPSRSQHENLRSAEGRVALLHRTVADFLNDQDVRDLLQQETRSSSSEIYERLMATILYRLKSRDYHYVRSTEEWVAETKDIDAFLRYGQHCGPVKTEYTAELHRRLTQQWEMLSKVPGFRATAKFWTESFLSEQRLKITPEPDDNPLLTILARYGFVEDADKILRNMDVSRFDFFKTGGKFIVLRLLYWAMQTKSLCAEYLDIIRSFMNVGYDLNAETSNRPNVFGRTSWEDLLILLPHHKSVELARLPILFRSEHIIEDELPIDLADRFVSWSQFAQLFIKAGANLALNTHRSRESNSGTQSARECLQDILSMARTWTNVSSAEIDEINYASSQVLALLPAPASSSVAPLPATAMIENTGIVQGNQAGALLHVQKMRQAQMPPGSPSPRDRPETLISRPFESPEPGLSVAMPAFASTSKHETAQAAIEALLALGFSMHQVNLAIEKAHVGYDIAGLTTYILNAEGDNPLSAKPSSFPKQPRRSAGAQSAQLKQWNVVARRNARQPQDDVPGAQYVLAPRKVRSRRPRKTGVSQPSSMPAETSCLSDTVSGAIELGTGTFTWFFDGHGAPIKPLSPEQVAHLQESIQSVFTTT